MFSVYDISYIIFLCTFLSVSSSLLILISRKTKCVIHITVLEPQQLPINMIGGLQKNAARFIENNYECALGNIININENSSNQRVHGNNISIHAWKYACL